MRKLISTSCLVVVFIIIFIFITTHFVVKIPHSLVLVKKVVAFMKDVYSSDRADPERGREAPNLENYKHFCYSQLK